MDIRYTASRRDVTALLRYNLRHSRRFRLVLLAVSAFPMILSAFLAIMMRRHVTTADLIPGLVIGPLAAFAIPILAILRTKHDERVLSVDANGIRTSIGKLSAELPWAAIASVDLTPTHIFITGTNTNGFAIPLRAFTSPEACDEFLGSIAAWRQGA
jgi:hypothetical protein